MSGKTIAYLFGAGASIGALPVVNQLQYHFKAHITKLKLRLLLETKNRAKNEFTDPQIYSKLEKLNNLIANAKERKDISVIILESVFPKGKKFGNIESLLMKYSINLNILINGNEKFFSIDTYFKSLFFQKKLDELEKMKRTFSLFLNLEERWAQVDSRYENLVAALAKIDQDQNNYFLPKDHRFFSWNYDSQFQTAYYKIFNNFSKMENDLYTASRPSSTVFHLNGQAILDLPHKKDLIEPAQGLSSLMEEYNLALESVDRPARKSNIKFAWEKMKEIKIGIQRLAKEVTDLVAVGYSFPIYNREIDLYLFSQMPNLKRVFIQNTPEVAKDLVQVVNAIIRNKGDRSKYFDAAPITYISQFYFPI